VSHSWHFVPCPILAGPRPLDARQSLGKHELERTFSTPRSDRANLSVPPDLMLGGEWIGPILKPVPDSMLNPTLDVPGGSMLSTMTSTRSHRGGGTTGYWPVTYHPGHHHAAPLRPRSHLSGGLAPRRHAHLQRSPLATQTPSSGWRMLEVRTQTRKDGVAWPTPRNS